MSESQTLKLDCDWWKGLLINRKIKSIGFNVDKTRIARIELDTGTVVDVMPDGKLFTFDLGPYPYGTQRNNGDE